MGVKPRRSLNSTVTLNILLWYGMFFEIQSRVSASERVGSCKSDFQLYCSVAWGCLGRGDATALFGREEVGVAQANARGTER